jgi:hypothetical protein
VRKVQGHLPETRLKTKISMLIERLQNQVLGESKMENTQIQAAKILFAKVIQERPATY